VKPTRTLKADADGIAEAASILRRGGLVAFPTETVYGLGANALSADAAARIFKAKGRPADDPLIVHIRTAAELTRIASSGERVDILAMRFWPGPLTLVVHKLPVVPDVVTAGLPTVAVRVPAHPLAQALLQAVELPLAAPSANLFGRTSPTRAEHVLDDLGGRIDAILDGGPTLLGVESTIVDVSGRQPRLLRPGGVPAEDIEATLGETLLAASETVRPMAPGMLPSHYAPRTPLVLITGDAAAARERLFAEVKHARTNGQRVGVLLLEDDRTLSGDAVTEHVGTYAQPNESAARLFGALRALDAANCDVLVARELADPTTGLGRALADRLRRAAKRVIEA
jgi:L-threonylcarbamoyladenylate synthase